MYQQRAEPEEATFAPLGPWQPDVRLADEREEHLEASLGDTYVVIDEIIAERVRLVVAPWPRIDASGRLAFDEGARVVAKAFALAGLERILNKRRHRAKQTERGLRVGDVFLVRVFDETAPSRWRGVRDVTSAARPVTKHAFLRAVAQLPPPRDLAPEEREPAPTAAHEEPAPPPAVPEVPAPKGSTVNPAV